MERRFLPLHPGKRIPLDINPEGVVSDATLTGLINDAVITQGFGRRAASTLGFVMQPRCGWLYSLLMRVH